MEVTFTYYFHLGNLGHFVTSKKSFEHMDVVMWLRIIIVILFFGILISLSSALGFLFKDTAVPQSKRTLYALGIRITLAMLMMLCIFYGFYSGILHSEAPWDHRI